MRSVMSQITEYDDDDDMMMTISTAPYGVQPLEFWAPCPALGTHGITQRQTTDKRKGDSERKREFTFAKIMP